MQCLFCAKGNLKEAKELYDFFASDMTELPEQDPVPPTWQENTAQAINGVMGWMKENQGTLAQAYDFLMSIVRRNPASITAAHNSTTNTPLPPINQ